MELVARGHGRCQPCIQPATDTHIALTIAETRRLLNIFLAAPCDNEFALGWSLWRRTVQARARRSHYKRRGLAPHALRP